MPLPTPNEGETQQDFVSRCMGDETVRGDFDTQEQRAAVCYSQWEEAHGKAKAITKQEGDGAHPSSHYLVVEDPQKPTTWHLRVKGTDGKPDHRLMGAAWAALHGGYRGNKYEGPGKQQAISKLRKMYSSEDLPLPSEKNVLKAISSDDETLRVGNYIVLFGGRDLEGIGSDSINRDGSVGEYFTPKTQLESAYTKTGVLYLDWEHGQDHSKGAPKTDDVLGYVDWSTAKADENGVWVERALFRRNQYVKWLEGLIVDGLVGTSSEAIPEQVKKADDGQIETWPLRRDTLTVTPMEPRMLTENNIQALKALGLDAPVGPESETEQDEARPEAAMAAVRASQQVQAEAELELIAIEEAR